MKAIEERSFSCTNHTQGPDPVCFSGSVAEELLHRAISLHGLSLCFILTEQKGQRKKQW